MESDAPRSRRFRDMLVSHKASINSFCKNQFPQKSVNLFFRLVTMRDKLRDLCGNCLLPNDLSNHKGYVDGFVRELTLAKQLFKHFMRDKCKALLFWGQAPCRHNRSDVTQSRPLKVS